MTDLRLAITALFEQASKWAVAFSGGADSFALLMQMYELARQHTSPVELFAVHVHHGLMPEADDWQRRATQLCQRLGIELIVCHVQVLDEGKGIEAAARKARYAAFSEVAQSRGIRHFALAHHLQDYAETLLFRLLRGTGVSGAQSMDTEIDYGSYRVYRPWLKIPHSRILQQANDYADLYDWHYVQDPSNEDEQYARGALRRYIVPKFEQFWPAWQENFLRFATLMAQTQRLTDDLADMDWQQVRSGEGLGLLAFRSLPAHRQANLLRYWLAQHHCKMPTQARLDNWLRQISQVHQLGTDRSLVLSQEDAKIILRDKVLYLYPKHKD